VGRVGFAGLAGLAGLVGLGFLVCAGVGLLAGDGEGFPVGRFLVGVSLFLTRFEDIEDFFIFPSFVLVHY
jgi:hypothetical protein